MKTIEHILNILAALQFRELAASICHEIRSVEETDQQTIARAFHIVETLASVSEELKTGRPCHCWQTPSHRMDVFELVRPMLNEKACEVLDRIEQEEREA